MSPARPSCDAPTSSSREPELPSIVFPLLKLTDPEDCKDLPLDRLMLPEVEPMPVAMSRFPLVEESLLPEAIESVPPVALALIPLAMRTPPPFANGPFPMELPANTLTLPPLVVLESPAIILIAV